MPFRAVFFDLDGVLVDSFDATVATMNDAARHRGIPLIEREALRETFGLPSERLVSGYFPDWSSAAFEEFYVARYPEYVSSIRAMPGAQSVLDELDARGIPTAVITNNPSPQLARQVLEGLGVIPHALVTAGDVARPKPAPDMIFRACEVLDVEPWDVLVVGDTGSDKQAAAAAGAAFAGIHGIAGNFTIADLGDVQRVLEGTFR